MLTNKAFWISALVAAVVIFIIAATSGRGYKSEMDILILPKSEVTASSASQIVADAVSIPRSLMFYNKMREENSDIEDAFAGFTDAKKKAAWNEMLKAQKVDGSGIVRVSIFNKSQFQAEVLSRQTAQDIATVLSRYYNIKTELDVRIIDGPIIKYLSPNFTWAWVIISILLGLAFGALLYLAINFTETLKFRSHLRLPDMARKTSSSDQEVMPVELPYFKKEIELDISGKQAEIFPKEEIIAAGSRKVSAPGNLPIEEEFSEPIVAEPIILEEEKVQAQAPKKTHEATPEEVKERLNRLLRGIS